MLHLEPKMHIHGFVLLQLLDKCDTFRKQSAFSLYSYLQYK